MRITRIGSERIEMQSNIVQIEHFGMKLTITEDISGGIRINKIYEGSNDLCTDIITIIPGSSNEVILK